MNINVRSLIRAIMVVATLSAAAWSFAPVNTYPAPGTLTAGQQVVQKFDSSGNTWVYLMYLPPTYESNPGKVWPMITFMVTLGGTNEYPFANIYDDKSPYTQTNGGPANLLRNPATCKYMSDSFIVMTPWYSYGFLGTCPGTTANTTTYLRPLFRHVESTIRIDTTRIHFMGYCFGGAASYRYATMYPTSVASVSMWSTDCGLACVDFSKLSAVDNIPLRLYGGTLDAGCPFASVQSFADTLKTRSQRTAPVVWQAVQGAGHECWHDYSGIVTDTLKSLYDWMLAQKKSPTAIVNPGNNQRNDSFTAAQSRVAAQNRQVEVLDLRGRTVSVGGNGIMKNLGRGVHIIRATYNGESVVRKVLSR